MKTVAIDLRPLESPTGKRGIGYYNKHLFEALLKKQHPDLQFKLFTFPKSTLRQQISIGLVNSLVSVPALYWPKKGLRRLDPFFSLIWSSTLNKIKPDLLHIPSLFEVYYLSIPDNITSIVTLYDTIPLLFPEKYFQNKRAEDWYLRRLNQAKKAAKIITISKSSKSDIQKFLQIPARKIEVIYGGVDESFKPIDKYKADVVIKKFKITRPYILTVSTHSFHKNIPRIFLAFKEYLKVAKIRDLNLVVVCKLIKAEEDDWKKVLKGMGIESRVTLTNFVPDEDLPYFYSGAKLLLFPSLYEGLGLPVLEAFASGCPVITSNVSSLPEIGGDAPYYVNPLKLGEIVRGIDKVLSDEGLKNRMIKMGFSQVKKFSWSVSADKLMKLYYEILH